MTSLEDARQLLAEADRAEELARSPLVERLAVLATFDPAKLDGTDAADVIRLLCERLPSRDAILGERRRIDALARMLDRGGPEELARVRRSLPEPADSPLQRMLDAFVLGGGPAVDDRAEGELVASLEVWRWATEAVARAGLYAWVTIEPDRDEIESRLALLDVTRAVRRLSAAGCVGREAELARLHDYRSTAARSEEPPMVVYGIGGVGKSTLVARFVMDLYEQSSLETPGVWAYLDLDRPTLASCEPEALVADITRQVAAQLGDERRSIVRGEEVLRRRRKGAGLEASDDAASHREHTSELARTVNAYADGELVVVLDTYEQLERHHPEQGERLYEVFALLAAELPRFRLIVSGRAPAAVFSDPSRCDRQLHVLALRDGAALELLRHFVAREGSEHTRPVVQVGDELGREVIALVGGIPLTVRLAARVLVQEGPDAIADVARRARTLDRVRSEFVRGFLYQRILDHVAAPDVPEDELRRVARAGIALRRITPDLVEHVLAGALEPVPATPATRLFAALGSEVAFAELQGGALRLREELRAPALTALRLDDPALVGRVHERAAAFYAGLTGDPDAALELAYHRLALGASAAEFDAATLRRLEPTAEELPPSSVTQVRKSLSDPTALPAAQLLEEWERKVFAEVDAALRGGQLDRARELLAERTERSPGTELHRLESRLAEAEGDLVAAAAAAELDLDAAVAAAEPTRFAAAAVRLAVLHELQAVPAAADDTLRRAAEAELLAGYPALRLELVLDRLNLRERRGLDTADERWLLELEARALLQRCKAREPANTALVRLLAAALGREEPDRIREAVREVGLGHEEDRARVQALVDALADWDAGQPDPGRLARGINLRVLGKDRAAIGRAWTAISGLGTDAGLVLDRIWREEMPPERVREALRRLYLWWAVADHRPLAAKDGRLVPAFLTEAPIDWSQEEVHQLEEFVQTAYPTSTEATVLASLAGLNLKAITRSGSSRRHTREILGAASREGRMGDLVQTILHDPKAASVHPPLRALVGDEWLTQRGI